MSQEEKQYTAEDYERYHSGKMPVEQMHALEKAALDDPFLQDALDGFAFSAAPIHETEKLRERFSRKKNTKRGLLYNISPLLKIASVIIIMAATWIIYDRYSPKENTLSKRTSVTSEKTTVPDTIQTITEKVISDQFNHEKQTERSNEIAKAKSEINKVPSREIKTEADSTREYFYEKTQGQVSRAEFPLHGNLAGAETEAAKSIRLKDAKQDPGAITYYKETSPANAPAQFQRSDSLLTSYNDVSKIESAESLSEVVITSANSKKKNQSKFSTQTIRSEYIDKSKRVLITNAIPVNGWQHFDDFAKANLKTIQQIDSGSVSTEVHLTFRLNENGIPVNVNARKSLCKICEEEAERFIRSCPPLKLNSKKKKGNAVVRF